MVLNFTLNNFGANANKKINFEITQKLTSVGFYGIL